MIPLIGMAGRLRHSTSSSQGHLDAYTIRMMASLAASLLLLTLCFRLPLDVPPTRIGWGFEPYDKDPLLDVVDIRQASTGDGAGVLVTTVGTRKDATVAGTDQERGDEEQEIASLPAPADPAVLQKLKTRPILEFAEQMPDITGGMGAYYIHIEYPPAAIAAGIEGRLVLNFVVEPDGSPTGIEVLQSLHPLCDSSAVHALRKTRFIPGRQNGVAARVRMRLPIRFRLIDTVPAGTPVDSLNPFDL